MRRILPPLRLLTVFETVLRVGGVKRAAAELNVSQPAISQSLRQLESHIGADLFDRSTRPAKLTDAGLLLHQATREGLDRIFEAVEEINRLTATKDRGVTVACSVGVATYWLMPRLETFYRLYPEIAVSVLTSHQGAPEMTSGVDIAIRYGNGKWSDGETCFLFDEEIRPVCAPEVAAQIKATGVSIEPIPLIHVISDDLRWLTWHQYLSRYNLPEKGRPRGLYFTNYVQATQAALSARGIMLGWQAITGDHVKNGRLVRINDAPLFPENAFYAVVSHRAEGDSSAALVATWLVDAGADMVADLGKEGRSS